MINGWRRFIIIFVGLSFASQIATAGDGHAQLGQDPRSPENGKITSDNFGFAFMQNVLKDSPQSDTCTTVDKHGRHTLTAIDGVASPENPEPILCRLSGDTATFEGRTGDCYYMVTGLYGGGPGTGGSGDISKWNSDFDTNSDELNARHFVVYINERYRSDDDRFVIDGTSSIAIELHNTLSGSYQRYFKLTQQPLSGNGSVVFVNSDGTPADPDQVYQITPDQPVCVYAKGADEGVVVITASETAPSGGPPTANPASKPATASAPVEKALSIVPDDGQIGTTGGIVASNKGATGEKHYVSPQKAGDFVVLKAINYQGTFDDNYKWDPVPAANTDVQPVAGSPDKIRVKRDAAKKIVTKLLNKAAPNAEVACMNVWIVWATGQGRKVEGPIIGRGTVVDKHNPTQRGVGTYVLARWKFTFSIAPTEMVFGNGDRPDFSGKNTADVPGAEAKHVTTGNKLKGGADNKWDVSRRMRVKALSSAVGSEWFDGTIAGTVYDGLPAANKVQEDYPTDDRVGNDDTATEDENNVPDANAQVTSFDRPKISVVRDAGGAVNDTVEYRWQFGEFVRLEIAGKWFRVSDFVDWRLHAKLKKVDEAVDKKDYNNNNNKTDKLWIDDGSTTDGTNNGW